MPFLTSLPLHRQNLPDETQPASMAWPWRRVLLWGGLFVLLLIILLVRSLTAEQRAIDSMEPQARAALFRDTWQSFQTLCQKQPAPALASRCSDQALFLQRFPECDEACHQQLDSFTRPSR